MIGTQHYCTNLKLETVSRFSKFPPIESGQVIATLTLKRPGARVERAYYGKSRGLRRLRYIVSFLERMLVNS